MENSIARPKVYPHIPLLPLAGLLNELDDSSAPPCRQRSSRPAPRRDMLAISPSTSPVSSPRDTPQSSSSHSVSHSLVPTQSPTISAHATNALSIASPSSNLHRPLSLAHTDTCMGSRASLRTCARARGRVSTNPSPAPSAPASISVLAWTTTPRTSSSPIPSTSPTPFASPCTPPSPSAHTGVAVSTHALADTADPILVSPQPHTPTASTPIASSSHAMACPLVTSAPACSTPRTDVTIVSPARGDAPTPTHRPRTDGSPLTPTAPSPMPASVVLSQPRPRLPCPPRRPASAAQLGRLAVARASQASAARVRAPISAAPAIAAARTAMLQTRRAADATTTALATPASISAVALEELQAAETLWAATQKPCVERPLTAKLRRTRPPPGTMRASVRQERKSVATEDVGAQSAPSDAHGPRIYAPAPLHDRTQRRHTPSRVPRPFTFDMHNRAGVPPTAPHVSASVAPAAWLHVGSAHTQAQPHVAYSSPSEPPSAHCTAELERALSRARARMCKTHPPPPVPSPPPVTSSRAHGAPSVRATASTDAKRQGAVDLDAVRHSIGLHSLPHTLLDEVGLRPCAHPRRSASLSRKVRRTSSPPVATPAPASARTTPASTAAANTASQEVCVSTITFSPSSLHASPAANSAVDTREAVRVLSERLQALASELAVLDQRVSTDAATSHLPADLASASASASALPALGDVYARVRESVFGPVGARRSWGEMEAAAYAGLGPRTSLPVTSALASPQPHAPRQAAAVTGAMRASLESPGEDDHARDPRATSIDLPDTAAARRPFTPRVVILRPDAPGREDARAAVQAEKLLRRASQRTLRHDGIDDRVVVTSPPRGLVLATSRMERERVTREPTRTPRQSVLARRFYARRPSSDLHIDTGTVVTSEAREREDYRIRQATFGARVAASHVRL